MEEAKILSNWYANFMNRKNQKRKFQFFQSFGKSQCFSSKVYSSLNFRSLVQFQSVQNIHKGIFFSKKEKIQKSINYVLQKYQRSNQDTLLFQRPFVREGEWIQSGDILADCSTSLGGELCLGKNIFIAYMPWEGYNYEDAILISQRLVTEDIYTSIHIESYEVETRNTKLGKEQITKKIPEIPESQLSHLDERGIVKRGTAVKEGDILVGKVTPVQKKFVSAYEKLLYTILEKELIPMRDSSLRTPKGLKAKVLEVKIFHFATQTISSLSKNKNFSSLFKNFFEKIGSKNEQYRQFDFSKKNLFQNPFFNKKELILLKKIYFENANSFLHKENLYIQFQSFAQKKNIFFESPFNLKKQNRKKLSFFVPFFFTNKQMLAHTAEKKTHLFSFFLKNNKKKLFLHGVDSKVQSNFNLPQFNISNLRNEEIHEKTFFGRSNQRSEKKNFVLYSKKEKVSKINKVQYSFIADQKNYEKAEKVQIYLVEKRKIQVGDKMSGRHGNKGIVSQILPVPDMPFLPDGTPLDMVLNPLGVPSRMNVGQIYECILGLASKYLQQYYRIQPFDEIYGPQASRSFTFSKLYEARQKTSQKWLFNPCYPGKIQIFDGRTGEPYENPVTVGISYILKLVHLVDDKIHARSTGPYSLVTQQPLKGRSKYGGQRLGEMEVWAIEAYGAAFVLLEMLTIKSDDISGRMTLWSNILLNMPIYIGTPESFKVLVCELQALCLDMGLYRFNKKGFLTQIEHLMQLP